MHFAPYYFNIIPKKVILVGDSAGGNLIAGNEVGENELKYLLALTVLCIKE